MATVINKRDVALQAASPRTATVNLGTTVNVNGTLNGLPVADVITAAYSGGSATENFFTQSASNPTGGASGDAHFNTSTGVMWFNINGSWVRGGTINASEITTGTLAAARIAANSITSDKIGVGAITANEIAAGAITATKLSVTTLSAITANLGTVTAGDIFGTSDIEISGRGVFKGNYTANGYAAAVHANPGRVSGVGVAGYSDAALGAGVLGDHNGSGYGVHGYASASGGYGVLADHGGSGFALACWGNMQMTSTTLVSNLNADMVDGKHASSLCQIVPTDSGTCTVSGNGFSLSSLVSGVRTRGTSNIVYIESISDIRLKDDIEVETLGLDFINSLIPVQYRLKARPETKYHGFIAQDVQKLINTDDDSLFQTHEDGMHGVDYMSLIAPLVKAIQELSKQVEELKDGQKAGSCN